MHTKTTRGNFLTNNTENKSSDINILKLRFEFTLWLSNFKKKINKMKSILLGFFYKILLKRGFI